MITLICAQFLQIFAGGVMAEGTTGPVLIPAPKKIVLGKQRIPVAAAEILLPADAPKAARYGATLFAKESGAKIIDGDAPSGKGTRITVADIKKEQLPDEGYRLKMTNDAGVWTVTVEWNSGRGALYGFMTLRQLLVRGDAGLCLAEAEVEDWPSYALRDFNRDGYDAMPDALALAEFMVPYKVNVVGVSHFWPWRTVPDGHWENVRKVCGLARATEAFDVMFYCNPYTGYHKESQINLLSDADLAHFLKHIRTALDAGATKVMVCVDDFTVWDKFTKEEKDRFKDLAAAQAFLMNHIYREIRKDFPTVEFLFCPAGPKGGYAGVPTKGSVQEHTLQVLAEELPKDVLIVWTGPEVRSRKIAVKDLEAWSRAAGGRKPFLWDNTIYAHYQPLFVETFLNPFRNTFPADLPARLGRGIHINGPNGASRKVALSLPTAADYLWNPEGYDPDASFSRSCAILAGTEATPLLLRFRDEAVAAIKETRAKSATAVESGKKAVATLDALEPLCADKELVKELRSFLQKQITSAPGGGDVFEQILRR